MGEAFFRQQLAATAWRTQPRCSGIHPEINALSGQISITLKPLSREISGELAKLTVASAALQDHNGRLLQQERTGAWLWQGLLAMALFLVGGICGMFLEKGHTDKALNHIGIQIERIQTPSLPSVAATKNK